MAQNPGNAKTISDFLTFWLEERPLSADNQQLLDNYYANWRCLRSPRMRFWYESQVREVEELIQSLERPRVLEVGVGAGTETLWFALLGADVTGIDAFRHCTSAAQERLNLLRDLLDRELQCHIKTVPLLKYADGKGFDIIWLEQAFHHLEPRTQVVDKIAALLRPGGYVVFSEANALNPLLQLQLFRARGFKYFIDVETEHGTVVYGNERIVSAARLAKEFKRVGIRKQRVRYFRLFPSHALFDRLFRLERAFEHLRFPPVFTHYNFVGRKPMKAGQLAGSQDQF